MDRASPVVDALAAPVRNPPVGFSARREERNGISTRCIARVGNGAVPEPATWAMMIGGFGLIGATMRRRRRTTVRFA